MTNGVLYFMKLFCIKIPTRRFDFDKAGKTRSRTCSIKYKIEKVEKFL